MFYKIGAKIERSLNFFFKWVLESILNGWKGWVFVIGVFSYCIFWLSSGLKQNFWETIYTLGFFVIFTATILLNQKYIQIRKIFDFIQHSMITFMISCSVVSALVIASYYSAIILGLIDLNQEKNPVARDFGLLIFMGLTLIVCFSFNSTSLLVKGYMQRYDEKWKSYHHCFLYFLPLVIIGMSSIWLIWVAYMKVELPHRAQEYIKVVVQTKLMMFAFVLHFILLLSSAYSIEKKHLENDIDLSK